MSHNLDVEDIQAAEFIAILNVRRVCQRCGYYYNERNNLGAHKCSFHPMPVNGVFGGRHPSGQYECCGRRGDDRSYPPGCTPCDHTGMVGHEPTRTIDARHCDMLGLRENRFRVTDPQSGDMVVYRRPDVAGVH